MESSRIPAAGPSVVKSLKLERLDGLAQQSCYCLKLASVVHQGTAADLTVQKLLAHDGRLRMQNKALAIVTSSLPHALHQDERERKY